MHDAPMSVGSVLQTSIAFCMMVCCTEELLRAPFISLMTNAQTAHRGPLLEGWRCSARL